MGNKKWLTVQISPEDAESLQLYATAKGISKTEVVRRYLHNLEMINSVIDNIEARVYDELLKPR